MVTQVETPRRSPFYRLGQFFQALTARQLAPSELEEIDSILTPTQQTLFRRMCTNDQRHSLQVLQTLIKMGEMNRDLLTAALLHDVGKSPYPLRLWERPVVVLIRRFRPATAVRWGDPMGKEPRGWKRPFIIYEQHPDWGAEMANAAGCSPLTTWLIRWHQGWSERGGKQEFSNFSDTNSSAPDLLRALQRADNAN